MSISLNVFINTSTFHVILRFLINLFMFDPTVKFLQTHIEHFTENHIDILAY